MVSARRGEWRCAGAVGHGSMHEEGTGVTTNLVEARRWYRMAADQGAYFAEEALERLGE